MNERKILTAQAISTIEAALQQARTNAEKDVRLYTSLGNQITQGEINILAKAQARLVEVDAALAELRQPGDGEDVEPLDWAKAEQHLETCERIYGESPNAIFALVYVIKPLRRRFDKGERTMILHDEIMQVEL